MSKDKVQQQGDCTFDSELAHAVSCVWSLCDRRNRWEDVGRWEWKVKRGRWQVDQRESIMKTCSDSGPRFSTCVCPLLVCVCVCRCVLVKGLAQSGPNQAFNNADHQYLISIHLRRLLPLSFFSLSVTHIVAFSGYPRSIKIFDTILSIQRSKIRRMSRWPDTI